MAGKDKTRQEQSARTTRPWGGRPSFAKDRVERGLEADDTRPLFAADSIHSTQEARFSFDSDGPAGGPVADLRSPIDEADEEERQRRGRAGLEQEREQDEDGD